MGKERGGLGIEDIGQESSIDLEGAISSSKTHKTPTAAIETEIKAASEKAGFPSRKGRTKRTD
jgi:hypothetical protein